MNHVVTEKLIQHCAVGAFLMAGYRQGAPPALIVAGAMALLVLAAAAGLAPVRLQRSDVDFAGWAQGAAYAALAMAGIAALAVAVSLLVAGGFLLRAF